MLNHLLYVAAKLIGSQSGPAELTASFHLENERDVSRSAASGLALLPDLEDEVRDPKLIRQRALPPLTGLRARWGCRATFVR